MTQNSGFPGSYVNKNEIGVMSTHSKQPQRIKLRGMKDFGQKLRWFFTKLRVFAEKLRVKTEKNSGQRRQNSGFPGSKYTRYGL